MSAAVSFRNSGRSLAPLTSAQSWRVLNLSTLGAGEGGRAANPFFHNKQLDRAIFIKHNLRAIERDVFSKAPDLATKIVVPFNHDDLKIGGYSVFFGENRFTEKLMEVTGLNPRTPESQRDFAILECIDKCPTLDPFVLRHVLQDAGFQIDERYFRINVEQNLKMNAKLISDIRPLVGMAIGKEPGESDIRMFLDSVFRTTPTELGLSFLKAIGVSLTDWPEMLFSWKAAIVAEDATEKLRQSVDELATILRELQVTRSASLDVNMDVIRRKKMIFETVNALFQTCSQKMDKFGTPARDEIIRSGKIAMMKNYLESLRENVKDFSLSFSLIDQVSSLVRFYFAKRGWSAPRVLAEDFVDVTNPLMEICSVKRT